MEIKTAIVTEEINTEEDLILFQNTTFKQDLKCKKIICSGETHNINAWNINACDINAGNINAWNIDACDINAGNINARVIICDKRIKKVKTSKTIAKVFVENIINKQKKAWDKQ